MPNRLKPKKKADLFFKFAANAYADRVAKKAHE